MSRTAESTIKGFLYQFQKTIKEILESSYEDSITIEGIVEDVDVAHTDGTITAIQCKYHESVNSFTDSLIYKPLLQMAAYYVENPNADISYRLFVHVPSEECRLTTVDLSVLNAALQSGNVTLQSIIKRIGLSLDKENFLKKLTLEFGESIDDLSKKIQDLLGEIGIKNADVENILYPNAINHIATLACGDLPQAREITRKKLEVFLSNSNSTAISKWTLALKSRKQILESKRKQLSECLSQNARERCFYFSKKQLDDFDERIIVFINNFLAKYHTKALHIKTPIFVFECDLNELKDIEYRLFKKGIKAHLGYIGDIFEKDVFFQEPIKSNSRSLVHEREFHVRILSFEDQPTALNHRKCDDLFFVCEIKPDEIDCTDINTSEVGVSNTIELEYVLSMRSNYE
ncbi:hypothetical protein ABN057_07060 [Providencia alcalifaciens]|uniref:hypothetical protein n=1 Tax=Providencia alcalifaciens TaxID=126385 RepID=UPI0032D9CE19